jgi:alkyldihydroxyacetonephosphate synthase
VSRTKQLADLLGADSVSVDEEDLSAHARDLSASALVRERAGVGSALPTMVVRPTDTAQVAKLLAWAHFERVPIVPFGGGSSVVRGIEPDGAIVVDLSGMDAVLDIDEKSRLVRVQAGIRGAALQDQLASKDLMLGHQPQSIALSTVGGWIATRAAGQLSLGFGQIEDVVVAFDAVLPGGRILRGKVTPRRSAGPSLGGLLMGSEGTLCVITEAVLRVVPLLVDRADVAFTFEKMADGVAACRAIAQSASPPLLTRLYDAEDTTIFWRRMDPVPSGPILIASARDAATLDRAAALAATSGGEPADEALTAYWWEHRNRAADDFLQTMAGGGILGPHPAIDTIEVSATWSNLRDLYHSMKERLREQADIVGCHLSHAYPDGACLYFTLASSCADDREAQQRLAGWWETAMGTTLAAGGSISHHHGIGRTRAAWLREELGDWYELLQDVKRLIDPNGIMNPGVLGL